MSESIEGYVEHIVYRNEENGYSVLSVEAKEGEVTCVGNVPSVEEGEYLKAEGDYTLHPTYGMQFRILRAQISVPQETAALERYLGSGAIRGVGPALAGRIVKKFGDDTMRIIEEEPERLAEVRGISEKKACDIGMQAAEKSQMQNALIFLSQYKIPLALGIKIYNKYQDTLYQVLKENPYQLAEDIQGVGFKTADDIAMRIGISRDSEFRVRSAILYVLSEAGGEGHMYLPEPELCRRVAELLGTSTGEAEISTQLMNLSVDGKIVRKTSEGDDPVTLVYSHSAYFTELDTARMLIDLNVVTGETEEEIDKRIRAVEKRDEIVLDDLQRDAVRMAARHGITILTGGPGTGKTTTINTMIRYFLSEGLNIALAAPTGRAARRMTDATGYEASTVHRLLEVSGMTTDSRVSAQFERNEDNPLEQDVIIIDEVSMVDIYLMHSLLKAIVPGTRLVLVGDRYQLPSVGPGSVLRDMIRSEAFPVVTLNKIFRQAQESDIIVNAHRIHAGLPVKTDNKSRDFFFIRSLDAGVIQETIRILVSNNLPKYIHADSSEIQIMTPSRKGALGVENLNVYLQSVLNPADPSRNERSAGSGILREGDKVMQIRNDYQLEWEVKNRYGIVADRGLGVFNGDTGIIKTIDPENETLTVGYDEGKTVQYTFSQLDEIELAYAVTVHKAQGSEYPAVIIPLLGVPHMLQTRNLLYTAVTRARKCVVLIGDESIFQNMISNETEERRYTTLAERIIEIEKGMP
ncbi:MAG: ATP-dependent RecD-like DNA helicase [Eubacteriales bacterium]|jgi:exodeoxyribonuclease V alpha subunit